jgi:hypothetical protein
MLWAVAWQQVPCGSMPAEEALIAARLGMKDATFKKFKPVLMRGWWMAEDGRLYHDTIVEFVRSMESSRSKTNDRKKLYTAKFERIRERDGCACVYCGSTKYLSLDHLIAVSRGGDGEDENLVTACRSCNSRKGARTPDEAGMTFVNKSAEAQWYELRSERNAFGQLSSGEEHGSNAFGTRSERGNDDTSTGTGTGTGLYKTEGTNTVRSEFEVGGAEQGPVRAGQLTGVMRDFGIQANPADPRIVSLASQGVPPETVRAACEEAKRSKPNERIAAGYILSIIERWAKEASGLRASGAKAPGRGAAQKFDPVAFVNRNRVSDNHERTDDIIDV